MGVPGPVDKEKGIVTYSNNIKWEDVPLAEMIGDYIPLPVCIANDAECAVFGETVARYMKESFWEERSLDIALSWKRLSGGLRAGSRAYPGRYKLFLRRPKAAMPAPGSWWKIRQR